MQRNDKARHAGQDKFSNDLVCQAPTEVESYGHLQLHAVFLWYPIQYPYVYAGESVLTASQSYAVVAA